MGDYTSLGLSSLAGMHKSRKTSKMWSLFVCVWQDAPLESDRTYDREERWQLPGLTGPDAIKPEEWQEFCTKVSQESPTGELHCICLRPK